MPINIFQYKKLSNLRTLYNELVPYETRYWLYKQRHLKEFRNLRQQVFHSQKGDFSLRSFDYHQCLFIHITKSAGTSVAKSLFGELPYHYTAIEYRVIYGRRNFNQYFKFAFVRNPWDRLYSAYAYLKGGGWNEEDRSFYNEHLSHLPDFNAFVLNWLTPERLDSHMHFKPQIEFVCDRKGRLLLDYLGYFEMLPDDFRTIIQRIGISANLAHVNASKRSDYRAVYKPEAIEKVGSIYRRDIEVFGYQFDGLKTRKYANQNGKIIP